MTEVVVSVRGTPPSPNNRRGHWMVAKDNAKWKAAACEAAAAVLPEGWVPLEACRIEVMFVVPDSRARDYDNAIAARKPLMDGLVAAGVMVDDSNRVVKSIGYGFTTQPGIAKTVFRIRSDGLL